MPSILIVDDEKSIREVLEILFINENFDVFTAKNIKESVAIIESNSVDIVLCDLVLGKENGLDLARLVKERGLNIPFVMITAYASAESAVESAKLGVIDYISKPFDNDALVAMVKQILDKPEEEISVPELDDIIGQSKFIRELKRKIIDISKG